MTASDRSSLPVSGYPTAARKGTVRFETWWAVWQIAQEAEVGRSDGPNYDSTLDNIYELAKGVLDDLEVDDRHRFQPSLASNDDCCWFVTIDSADGPQAWCFERADAPIHQEERQ